MEISSRGNVGFRHSNLRNGDVASNSAVFTGIFGRENLVATPKTNQKSFNFSLFSDVMLLFTSFGVTKTIRIK